MATTSPELPALANVGLYDAFKETSHTPIEEDIYYPENDPHPYEKTINDLPDGDSVDYVEWEAERANTYAGIYIDDAAKVEFLKVLFPGQFPAEEVGRGRGYVQLKGSIKAHEAGLRTLSQKQLKAINEKLNEQWNDITTALTPFLDAENIPQDEQSRRLKIEAMIDDARKQMFEKMKENDRKEEVGRLLAVTALKDAA